MEACRSVSRASCTGNTSARLASAVPAHSLLAFSTATPSLGAAFSQWSPRCSRDFALLGQPSPGCSDGGLRYVGPIALCASPSFQVSCRQILNCLHFGESPKSRKNASHFAVPKQSSVPTSNLDHPSQSYPLNSIPLNSRQSTANHDSLPDFLYVLARRLLVRLGRSQATNFLNVV